MSARSGIPKALAEGLKDINGTGRYVSNIYGSTGNKVVHFDDVTNFPYISVTPGAETRDDQPSNISQCTLRTYIRIYVNNAEDAQGELENLITDVETFLDTHLRMEYTELTYAGEYSRETLINTIVSIDTDEGLLDPFAIGEIVVDIDYEKVRQPFTDPPPPPVGGAFGTEFTGEFN